MSVCAAGCSVFVEVGELTQCDASRASAACSLMQPLRKAPRS